MISRQLSVLSQPMTDSRRPTTTMPTESTKAAVQQLRDAGFEPVAEKLRDLVLEREAVGASASIGFIEWQPERGNIQILIRIGGTRS